MQPESAMVTTSRRIKYLPYKAWTHEENIKECRVFLLLDLVFTILYLVLAIVP